MEGKLEVRGYRGKHFNESNNQSPLILLFGFVAKQQRLAHKHCNFISVDRTNNALQNQPF